MGIYSQTFGVSADKRLYLPALGEETFDYPGEGSKYWGERYNENMTKIAAELKDLSNIKMDRISDEVIDALSFGIKGKATTYNLFPPASGFNLNDMYFAETPWVSPGNETFPRGLYRIEMVGVTKQWVFFISIDPINISFLDLVDVPSSFSGQNGKSLIVDEVTNRLVFASLVTQAEFSNSVGLLNVGIIQLNTKVDERYSHVGVNPLFSNSNARLRSALDAEIVSRINADNAANNRMTNIENVDIAQTTAINGLGIRVTNLETFQVVPRKFPLRVVVDDLVSESVVFGLGAKPSSYGYTEGERVAINQQGATHNGDIYIATQYDTWAMDTPYFHGIGVYNNTDNTVYFYDRNDRNGQYRNLLYYAGVLAFAPAKDYYAAWRIKDFYPASVLTSAPSTIPMLANEFIAINDLADPEHGRVYRANLSNDTWVLVENPSHGLCVFNRNNNTEYYYSGNGIGQEWRIAVPTGALTYKGVHDASTGSYPAAPILGDYWKVSVAGIISGVDYEVNDVMIFNGATWDKIDNTEISYPADAFTLTEVSALQSFASSINQQIGQLGTDGNPSFYKINIGENAWFSKQDFGGSFTSTWSQKDSYSPDNGIYTHIRQAVSSIENAINLVLTQRDSSFSDTRQYVGGVHSTADSTKTRILLYALGKTDTKGEILIQAKDSITMICDGFSKTISKGASIESIDSFYDSDDSIVGMFNRLAIKVNTAQDFALLKSPDNTVWKISVDNGGNITTEVAP